MNQVIDAAKERMQKTTDKLSAEYTAIQAGRANAAILDKIMIDYYGTPTPVNQVAAISIAESRVLTIQPWDISLLNIIEKAIQTSDIGINPQNDGKIIRLIFPQLTEDRRKEIAKEISKMAEDAKIAVRNSRRDAIDKIKTMKKNSEITKDDQSRGEKKVQDLTDKFCGQIDNLCTAKTKQVMEL